MQIRIVSYRAKGGNAMFFSIIGFVASIVLILIILKQYIYFWLSLDSLKMKWLKYLLPISEILLIILHDGLFLLPSVTVFLIFIYKNILKYSNKYISFYNIDRRKFSFKKEYILYTLLLAPLLLIFADIISVGIINLFKTFEINLSSDGNGNIYNSKHIIDYLVQFGLICIVAPIVEEFTFRFIIYHSWLSHKFDKKIYAVLLSSLMFTFSHFDVNVFIFTFITGVMLCFIYDGFGFLSSVTLHMLFNVYAFLGFMGIIISKSIIVGIALISLIGIIILNIFKKPKFGIFRSRS